MKLIQCSSCDTEISPKAATCPKCGHPNEKAKQPSGAKVFFTIALVGGMFYWLAGGGMDKQVARDMQNIENKVATEVNGSF